MDEQDRRVTVIGCMRGAVRAPGRPATVGSRGRADDDYLFALAMACAEIDHQHLRDRPWGTLNWWPGQAAAIGSPAR